MQRNPRASRCSKCRNAVVGLDDTKLCLSCQVQDLLPLITEARDPDPSRVGFIWDGVNAVPRAAAPVYVGKSA